MTDKQHNEIVEKCAQAAESMKRFYTVRIDEIAKEIRFLKKGVQFCEVKKEGKN